MLRVDTVLWRGARPGTPEGPSWADMKQIGPHRILSLESGWFEATHDELYREDEDAQANGFTLHHVPLSDFWVPSQDALRIALSLMSDSVPTYVHCLHGKDRTGYVCAAYRILKQGWTPDAAIAEMLRLGFHRFPYWFWIPSLRSLKS